MRGEYIGHGGVLGTAFESIQLPLNLLLKIEFVMFRYVLAAMFLSISMSAMAASSDSASTTKDTASVTEDSGKQTRGDRRARAHDGDKEWKGKRRGKRGARGHKRGDYRKGAHADGAERGRRHHRGKANKREMTPEEIEARKARREEWQKKRQEASEKG